MPFDSCIYELSMCVLSEGEEPCESLQSGQQTHKCDPRPALPPPPPPAPAALPSPACCTGSPAGRRCVDSRFSHACSACAAVTADPQAFRTALSTGFHVHLAQNSLLVRACACVGGIGGGDCVGLQAQALGLKFVERSSAVAAASRLEQVAMSKAKARVQSALHDQRRRAKHAHALEE